MIKYVNAALTWIALAVGAAMLGDGFVPHALIGLPGEICFGLLFVASTYAGNRLRPPMLRMIGSDSYAWFVTTNLVVRLLLPALIILLAHLIVPNLIALPEGVRSVFALVWIPTFVASVLGVWKK